MLCGNRERLALPPKRMEETLGPDNTHTVKTLLTIVFIGDGD